MSRHTLQISARTGEDWVSEGMRIQSRRPHQEECPFCARDLSASPVISHYRAYFGEAYHALKRETTEILETVNRAHGGDAAAGFERAVRSATDRLRFWSQFCELREMELDTAEIIRDWAAARQAISAQLSSKQAAPLDRMALADETRRLVEIYRSHVESMDQINEHLDTANLAIEVVKEQAAGSNLDSLTDDLARLRAVKARYEPSIDQVCNEFVEVRKSKEETERDRERTRIALEQHRTTVFPGYQTAINIYLQRFNAGFRLSSVAYANTRGGPTCTYSVLINNTPVAVGGAEPGPGAPAFRNTLSAGDRNTLVLCPRNICTIV